MSNSSRGLDSASSVTLSLALGSIRGTLVRGVVLEGPIQAVLLQCPLAPTPLVVWDTGVQKTFYLCLGYGSLAFYSYFKYL